ncbi:zinc knuckle [Colletotrichum orchidophilum]|uniref:Zinc knuckle n=1 Tax=Colletotrichum orchidophilum TaxID=1209926 RepID=A0A1G4AXI8_9PEZI|nr:zinc knuckle [Colletotrichum orchidophilum]OHE93878.1 zinc knuckle [Colletotrichum orchidophilum]
MAAASTVKSELQQTRQTSKTHMGDDTTSTVYAGELHGIVLTLGMAQADKQNGTTEARSSSTPTTKPLSDRQPNQRGNLARTSSRSSQSRHKPSETKDSKSSSVGCLLTSASRTTKQQMSPRKRPRDGGRADSQDRQAKSLVQAPVHNQDMAAPQSHQTWQTNWEAETRGRTSFRLTPKPIKKVLELHKGLSKRQSALLVQMRTGKIGLQDFLFNRRVPGTTSANCTCREGRQTVSHILLRCRRFRQLRRQEFETLPGRHNLRIILNKRKAAAKAIRFVEQTEILRQHGIESQPRQS